MNESPICPWCRGPVLRSARRCWVCIPCSTLYENAKRTGEPLPRADMPFFDNLVTDEPTPPGVCPRFDDELAPYEGWYDGLIRHHWGLRRIAARRDLRCLKEEAASKARRDEQALRAMADGPEAFRKRLDRPPRIELTADKLINRRSPQEHWFAHVAAGEVRTDIAAVLQEEASCDQTPLPHAEEGGPGQRVRCRRALGGWPEARVAAGREPRLSCAVARAK